MVPFWPHKSCAQKMQITSTMLNMIIGKLQIVARGPHPCISPVEQMCVIDPGGHPSMGSLAQTSPLFP